jgi:arylsulfatase A-like enzyme
MKPNILLISTDQQRFDTVGEKKPSFLRTPHLANLEAEGVIFRRTYADCPVCVPGRVALMTGQSCYRHGMGTNAPTDKYFDTCDTLPTLLKESGYHTAMVGKAHFHPQRKRHGFDQTITLDSYYRMTEKDGGPRPRRHGLGENELVATLSTVSEERTLTSWITERSCQWIREDRDPSQPWFLWVSYSKPHAPLDPPEPYYSMYRNSPIPEPFMGTWEKGERCPYCLSVRQHTHAIDLLDAEQIRSARAAYYGLITHIDYNIGRLTAAIQDTGAFFSPIDNTLIIFWSDHGDHLGDHGRTAKDDAYESSWHVPMIMRLPRTWSKDNRLIGRKIDSVTCIQDIYSTCLTAAGATLPKEIIGQDLFALAKGELQSPRKWLLGGFGFNKNNPDNIEWSAVTDGNWKYIWHYDGGLEQLFDLKNDPHELTDLGAEPAFETKRSDCRNELVRQLREQAPKFVDGDHPLIRPPKKLPSIEEMRAGGFPGHMWDMHPSDATH